MQLTFVLGKRRDHMFQPNLVQVKHSWFLLTTAAEENSIFFIKACAKLLCFCGFLLLFNLWALRLACPSAVAGGGTLCETDLQ